jgi:hypothetical protein
MALWEDDALGVVGQDGGASGPEVPNDDRGIAKEDVEAPSWDKPPTESCPF